MANWGQFGAENDPQEMRLEGCALCEALLPEAVDGTLSAVEQAAFDRHVATCADCARELEEAHRGAAWLSLLKDHAPEPPAALLQRILADTTGVSSCVAAVPAVPMPVADEGVEAVWGVQPSGWTVAPPPKMSWWASLRTKLVDVVRIDHGHTGFQPRFAMTAAMAFFSIALSLNMAGVRLRDLRAEDFSPSGVRRAVADAGASAERKFQNIRVVYQMESRVDELRTVDRDAQDSNSDVPAPAPDQQEKRQPAPQQDAPTGPQKNEEQPKPRGSSRIELPLLTGPKQQAVAEGIS